MIMFLNKQFYCSCVNIEKENTSCSKMRGKLEVMMILVYTKSDVSNTENISAINNMNHPSFEPTVVGFHCLSDNDNTVTRLARLLH